MGESVADGGLSRSVGIVRLSMWIEKRSVDETFQKLPSNLDVDEKQARHPLGRRAWHDLSFVALRLCRDRDIALARLLPNQLFDMLLGFSNVGKWFSKLLAGCTDATKANENFAPLTAHFPKLTTRSLNEFEPVRAGTRVGGH